MIRHTRRSLGFFLTACFLVVQVGWAQSGRLQRGLTAYASGAYEEAIAHFEAVRKNDAGYEDAQYWLVRIYLDSPVAHNRKARRLLKEALQRNPDAVRFMELELQRRYQHPPAFLPVFGEYKREQLAEQILAQDPENALAHRILGIIAYHDFAAARYGVNFGQLQGLHFSASERAESSYIYALDADLVETETGYAIHFINRDVSDRRIDAVSDEVRADSAAAKAIRHLQRAVANDGAGREAYLYLLRTLQLTGDFETAANVVAQMQAQFPAEPDGWLFGGLVALHMAQYEAAATHFERGIALLPPAQQQAFRSIEPFLRDDEKDAYRADPAAFEAAFWQYHDVRLLSPVNERQAEHYARLVYADLRFGLMTDNKRGWETEPGQVVVRYGAPLAEAQYQTMEENFLLFHYGDMQFRFMDYAKAGHYTFYSPSARDFQGPLNVHREWGHDYKIKGPETFRARPQQTQLRIGAPFDQQTSVFFEADGTARVVVAAGVPLRDTVQTVQWGAFLLDEARLVAEQRAVQNVEASWLPLASPSGEQRILAQQLAVPTGRTTLAFEYESLAHNGSATPLGNNRTPLVIEALEEGKPAISDLLLARHIEEGEAAQPQPDWIDRGGLHIAPLPWAAYTVGQPLYFYFEVYQLGQQAGEAQYEVEAILVAEDEKEGLGKLLSRVFGGEAPAGVSAAFRRTSRQSRENEYLVLETTALAPGKYVLAVRVTDQVLGKTVEASRVVEIR